VTASKPLHEICNEAATKIVFIIHTPEPSSKKLLHLMAEAAGCCCYAIFPSTAPCPLLIQLNLFDINNTIKTFWNSKHYWQTKKEPLRGTDPRPAGSDKTRAVLCCHLCLCTILTALRLGGWHRLWIWLWLWWFGKLLVGVTPSTPRNSHSFTSWYIVGWCHPKAGVHQENLIPLKEKKEKRDTFAFHSYCVC
jgi:hypothetical protein